ncbi:Cro/C1-type helix-turn-helix domain [Methylophilaceae bacterium]
MKTTIDYLNAVKVKTGATSDYALAKKLDISRAAISKYRLNGDSFSDEVAIKVASILQIDPIMVIASTHAARSKSSDTKAMWNSLFERLGGMAAALVVGVGLTASPAPAQAFSDAASHNSQKNVYYVKLVKSTYTVFS